MTMLLYLTAAVALAGTALNVYRRRAGFILWFLTDCIFAVIDYRAGLHGQAALMVVYAGMAVWGYFHWGKR